MWTITEIANKIMKYSSPISKNQDCTFEEVGLPEKYYEVQSSNFTNDKIYLPNEFLENNFHSNFMFNVRLTNNFLLIKYEFNKDNILQVSRKRSSDEECLQNGDGSKKQKQFAV